MEQMSPDAMWQPSNEKEEAGLSACLHKFECPVFDLGTVGPCTTYGLSQDLYYGRTPLGSNRLQYQR